MSLDEVLCWCGHPRRLHWMAGGVRGYYREGCANSTCVCWKFNEDTAADAEWDEVAELRAVGNDKAAEELAEELSR